MSVRYLGVVAAMAAMGLVACGDDTGGGGAGGATGSGGAAATTTGSGGGTTSASTTATGTGGAEVGPCNEICNTTEDIPTPDECTTCGTDAALGGDCATEGTACLTAVADAADEVDCCPCGPYRQGGCEAGGYTEDLCGSHETLSDDLSVCICEVCS